MLERTDAGLPRNFVGDEPERADNPAHAPRSLSTGRLRSPPVRLQILLLALNHRDLGGAERLSMATGQVLDRIGDTYQCVRITEVRTFSRPGFVAEMLLLARRPWDLVVATHPHLAYAATAIARRASAPSIVQTHGTESWGRPRRSVAHGVRRATRVIASTQAGAELASHATGARLDHFAIFPPPASAPENQPDTITRSGIVAAGRLRSDDRYKGFDSLIRAWPEVTQHAPGSVLTIIGDGDDRIRLERLARDQGVQGLVRFLGRVNDDVLGLQMRNAVAFAMPSEHDPARNRGEGFGIVYAEAALRGTPSIALDTPILREVIHDGHTGLLARQGDIADLARAIIAMLSDSAHTQTMGAAAKELADREYAKPVWEGRLARLVHETIGEPAPSNDG